MALIVDRYGEAPVILKRHGDADLKIDFGLCVLGVRQHARAGAGDGGPTRAPVHRHHQHALLACLPGGVQEYYP
jgi:hypothetical protein